MCACTTNQPEATLIGIRNCNGATNNTHLLVRIYRTRQEDQPQDHVKAIGNDYKNLCILLLAAQQNTLMVYHKWSTDE